MAKRSEKMTFSGGQGVELAARLDFPDPDKPVITTNLFLGMATFTFFRLCKAAPFIIIYSFGFKLSIFTKAL